MSTNHDRQRQEFETAYAALNAAIHGALDRLIIAGPKHDESRKRLLLAAHRFNLAWGRLAAALDGEREGEAS